MLVTTAVEASVYGTLSNFDVFNNSGSNYYGFEIELEGVSLSDIPSYNNNYYTYRNWHYGSGQVDSYTDGSLSGVRIRYFDNAVNATIPYAAAILPTNGHTCITIDGCEHFGVGVNGNATATRYFWLDDTGNRSTQVNLLAPSWNVVQPAVPAQGGQPAQPAVVKVEVQAPEVEPNALRSDAIWVQIFKTEIEHELELDELVADNNMVPDAANGVTEIEWKLFQRDPANPDQNVLDNGPDGEEIGDAFNQVLRTYLFYEFAGAYDESHEAICTEVGNCEDLAATNDHLAYVGAPIGQQMAAVNLAGALVAPVPLPAAFYLFLSSITVFGWLGRRGNREMTREPR